MSKVTYDSVVKKLKESKTNITCDDLVGYLRKLGYEVVPKNSGKHHTYDHPDLDWIGSHFDCGHGRNPKVLPRYIEKIIKILERHEEDFEEASKGKNDE